MIKTDKDMKNRLPLPTSTVKLIKSLIEENNDLMIKNPLKNVLASICSYDYSDAVRILGYLKKDYPNLMEYNKHTMAIKKAETRYNLI